jgi:hypothetical protein
VGLVEDRHVVQDQLLLAVLGILQLKLQVREMLVVMEQLQVVLLTAAVVGHFLVVEMD